MANQHTKKKADEVKKSETQKGPEIVLHPVSADFFREFFKAQQTPLMNKADEKAKSVPHFTLLPSDNFTPVLVRAWINYAIDHNVPEQKILEAKVILKNIEQWRTDHPTSCKTPD